MFITFEGIEGSGKTSLMPRVAAHLEQQGRRCLITREPGGTPIGRQIRAILLDPNSGDLDPGAELLLYTADRVQHVRTVIAPAIADGRVVLCDRYVDATRVYQGLARGLGLDSVDRLHQAAVGGMLPDLTVLLDLDPEIGLARAWRQVKHGERSGEETRFEKEALHFHRRVRDGYRLLAAGAPERFCVIDAAAAADAVAQDVIAAIDRWMAKRPSDSGAATTGRD
ncbi:MAG: dTMP kinase [Pseudomonadota bacterium]